MQVRSDFSELDCSALDMKAARWCMTAQPAGGDHPVHEAELLKCDLPGGRYDRPTSPQRDTDVDSNIVASLPSSVASHSCSSSRLFGRRPLTPSKRSCSAGALTFSNSSFPLMAILRSRTALISSRSKQLDALDVDRV